RESPREDLGSHELPLVGIQRRCRQPVREDGPRRVEGGSNAREAEAGPVLRWLDREDASERCRCLADGLLRIVVSPALARREQKRLHALRCWTELLRSAEEVHVCGDDLVGSVAANNHLETVYVEGARR